MPGGRALTGVMTRLEIIQKCRELEIDAETTANLVSAKRRVVYKVWSRKKKYTCRKLGRKKLSAAPFISALKRLRKRVSYGITLEDIKREARSDCHIRTISRKLNEAGFHSFRLIDKIKLSEKHMAERVEWCQQRMALGRGWENWYFGADVIIDNTKVLIPSSSWERELYLSQQTTRVWRSADEYTQPFATKQCLKKLRANLPIVEVTTCISPKTLTIRFLLCIYVYFVRGSSSRCVCLSVICLSASPSFRKPSATVARNNR